MVGSIEQVGDGVLGGARQMAHLIPEQYTRPCRPRAKHCPAEGGLSDGHFSADHGLQPSGDENRARHMELLGEPIRLGEQAFLDGDGDRLGSQAPARPAAFAGTLKPRSLCGGKWPEGVPDELPLELFGGLPQLGGRGPTISRQLRRFPLEMRPHGSVRWNSEIAYT